MGSAIWLLQKQLILCPATEGGKNGFGRRRPEHVAGESGTGGLLRQAPAAGLPALRGWRRGHLRFLVSAMAGVAGDVFLAVGEPRVDVLRQDAFVNLIWPPFRCLFPGEAL